MSLHSLRMYCEGLGFRALPALSMQMPCPWCLSVSPSRWRSDEDDAPPWDSVRTTGESSSAWFWLPPGSHARLEPVEAVFSRGDAQKSENDSIWQSQQAKYTPSPWQWWLGWHLLVWSVFAESCSVSFSSTQAALLAWLRCFKAFNEFWGFSVWNRLRGPGNLLWAQLWAWGRTTKALLAQSHAQSVSCHGGTWARKSSWGSGLTGS